MLFRTVHGPELEAIYRYIIESNSEAIQPDRETIQTAFIARQPDGDLPSTQSIDDALAFLESAQLVERVSGYRVCKAFREEAPFALQVLEAMRRLERAAVPAAHAVDPLYALLLTEVFIRPDQLFVAELHPAANQLAAVKEAGGLSREKIGTWKRVMSFLGVGRRLPGGFQCVYSSGLVQAILGQWGRAEGTLQHFLEDCFGRFLPYARADSELAHSVQVPLLHLLEREKIALFPLQDSPTRSYFDRLRYKGIAWKGEDYEDH